MYALGMMTTELLTGQDIFHLFKRDCTLRSYAVSTLGMVDHVKAVIRRAATEYNLDERIVDISMACVKGNPDDRINILKWNEAWREAHT